MMSLGQLKALLAAIPSSVPDSAEVRFKFLNGDLAECQHKIQAFAADVEIYDSNEGIQNQELSPNKVLLLQE